MKEKVVGVRLDEETLKEAKKLAPEGNISMWIRSLIRKEIENKK
jgi:hypothetical protein